MSLSTDAFSILPPFVVNGLESHKARPLKGQKNDTTHRALRLALGNSASRPSYTASCALIAVPIRSILEPHSLFRLRFGPITTRVLGVEAQRSLSPKIFLFFNPKSIIWEGPKPLYLERT